MQVVAAHSTMTVPVEYGRSTITLKAATRYVMHDVEVASGKGVGAFKQVAAIPDRPRRFDPHAECSGRMIMPFIGGLGDVVSMLPILAAISRQHPGLHIDVTTTPGPAEVFSLSPRVQRIVAYPMRLPQWRRYDHYLSMEVVHETAQQPGRALPEVFAAALGMELAELSFELTLPPEADAVAKPSSVPLVGVAVGEGQALRSYPLPMLRSLVSLLAQRGVCCVLLGHNDPGWNLPVCPPVITDMRSKTPSVLALAVWLRAVDVVIAHDSFVLHLAGALGRPTIALFAPTASAHASPYANAVALASATACSPCHEAAGRCPKGLDRCVAWDCPAVQPAAVADAVVERLNMLGRRVPAAQAVSAVL